MSFLIKQNLFQYNPSGVFIHVPKCAGTTAQAIFKKCGYRLYRKNKGYRGHLTLSETIGIMKKSFTLNSIKKMEFYIILRESTSWMESFFRYIIEKQPKVHGCKWEHENFTENGIMPYIQMTLASNGVSAQLPKHASKLPYRKLSSYISLKGFDISGIEETNVFCYEINSIDALALKLSGFQKHNCVGSLNQTSGKKILSKELLHDSEKLDRIKRQIYDYHYSEIDFADRLFSNGSYSTTFRELQ